jgi:ectoine hydroxylase-related dioxygenase (phytanoyl-CoA dioxygenase family)
MDARPTTEFIVDVTPEQIAFFRANGYLSIDRITSDEEIEWLKGIYDTLFRQRMGEQYGEYFDLGGKRAHTGEEVLPQVLGPEKKFPLLRETNYFGNARRIIAQLLGADEANVSGGGHMIMKPARYGAPTPWHQDEAYWDPDLIPNSASAWLPLDVATVSSGCLQFIPGSHHEDIHWHKHINDDPTIHGLVTEEVDPSKAVACPLQPGGATFHHCRTLHYAGPNTTDNPRRAYILVLGTEPLKRETPMQKPWIDEEREALAKLNSLARPGGGG